MSNKQKVLDYIKHDRTLTTARNIYNSLPNKSLSFLASINRLRATEANIKHVTYQLCKAVGIPERQMLALWQNKVTPAKTKKETKVVNLGPKEESLTDRLLAFDAEKADWSDIQALAADVSEATDRKADGRTKDALLSFIQQEREIAIAELAKEVPPQVKQSIKIREHFPFLRQKDCPEVLKLLVNDLITAYENYKEGREKLFDAMTQEEEAILAGDIVDNFIENKQAFAELEHYSETGHLLGEHPIFEERKIKEDLEALSAEELNKKYNALRKNISTNGKKAEEAEDAEKKAEYEAAVENYTWQLEYVKELLKKK